MAVEMVTATALEAVTRTAAETVPTRRAAPATLTPVGFVATMPDGSGPRILAPRGEGRRGPRTRSPMSLPLRCDLALVHGQSNAIPTRSPSESCLTGSE